MIRLFARAGQSAEAEEGRPEPSFKGPHNNYE